MALTATAVQVSALSEEHEAKARKLELAMETTRREKERVQTHLKSAEKARLAATAHKSAAEEQLREREASHQELEARLDAAGRRVEALSEDKLMLKERLQESARQAQKAREDLANEKLALEESISAEQRSSSMLEEALHEHEVMKMQVDSLTTAKEGHEAQVKALKQEVRDLRSSLTSLRQSAAASAADKGDEGGAHGPSMNGSDSDVSELSIRLEESEAAKLQTQWQLLRLREKHQATEHQVMHAPNIETKEDGTSRSKSTTNLLF